MTLKMNQDEKANYRVGQNVTCDYYGSTKFRVLRKCWGYHGELTYTLTTAPRDAFIMSPYFTIDGIKEKEMNPARK